MEKISSFVTKNMTLLVVAVTIFALVIPSSLKWVPPHIPILLGVIMFGMGMTLRVEDFKEIFRRPRDVLIGVLAQFTIMPLLAYALAKIFQPPAELAAGVILVGTCPGGTASNVITYLAKGDLALSVSISMASTILAPIVTPLLTWILADAWVDVSFFDMMLSIVQVVILPILLGIIVNNLFGDLVKSVVKILPVISIVAILLILGSVVSVNADKILQMGLIVMLVVVLHNLCGYGLGYCAAKISKMNVAKTKAISIEVGMQNSGLAVSLAMTHFSAAAAIPGAIFSVWHNISGSIMANYLSQKSNKLN
ncbi:MAG: bile acid:sodium symporter family protein [Selenomonadaceae bacterium]|nr:bile acid:sodium symporter family protein [Selenomonadaceae bacterium]